MTLQVMLWTAVCMTQGHEGNSHWKWEVKVTQLLNLPRLILTKLTVSGSVFCHVYTPSACFWLRMLLDPYEVVREQVRHGGWGQSPCPALPCPALPCPALPCPALPCPALK